MCLHVICYYTLNGATTATSIAQLQAQKKFSHPKLHPRQRLDQCWQVPYDLALHLHPSIFLVWSALLCCCVLINSFQWLQKTHCQIRNESTCRFLTELSIYVQSNTKGSFRRYSFQPISWLTTEKLNLSQLKQTCIHNKIYNDAKSLTTSRRITFLKVK